MRRLDARWWVLAVPLAATILAALVHDPTERRGLYDREASFWLAAASLAHDLDSRLASEDLARFEEVWQRPPDVVRTARATAAAPGLAEPVLPALLLAPAVRLLPARGIPLAVTVLWALAVLAAVRAMARTRGPEAALWGALWAFGSVAFAAVFRPLPEAVALAAVIFAFALLEGAGEDGDQPDAPEIWGERPLAQPSHRLRLAAAGALIGLAATVHPVFLLLLVPAALWAVPGGWLTKLVSVASGAVIVLVASSVLTAGARAPWPTEALRYTSASGYPITSATAAAAPVAVEPLVHPMRLEDRLSPRLIGWNALYLVAGRSIGVVPYFLPVLLALGAAGSGTRRLWIAGTALLGLVVLALLDPFDLAAAPAAVANGRFLPFYGACLFLPAALPRRWVLAAALLVAGPLLWPLWLGAAASPLGDGGGYRHVGPLASRYLPVETTQRHLPGGEWVEFGGTYARPVGGAVWERPGSRTFELTRGSSGEILIAHRGPLSAILLSFGPEAPSDIRISGGEPGPTVFRPDGGVDLRVEPASASRRHPMWWGPGEQSIYRIGIRVPEAPSRPLAFGLAVEVSP